MKRNRLVRRSPSARTLTVSFLMLAGFVAAAPRVQAQDPATPLATPRPIDRLWWSIGVGGAGTRFTCDLCEPGRDLGPAVIVAVGSQASPALRVGLEGSAWTFEETDELREKVFRAGVVANVRPELDRGLYLTGGIGWLTYRAGEGFRYNAPSLSLGLGWDFPLTSTWRIGNQVTLDGSSFGRLKNEETTVDRNVGFSMIRFSVQLNRP